MKHSFLSVPLLTLSLSLGLFSFPSLAASLSSISLTVKDTSSGVQVSRYSEISRYSIKSTDLSGDELTIRVSSGSGNTWSSTLKKSNVSIFGDYSNGNILSLDRSSTVATIVLRLDETVSSGSSSSGSSSSSSGSSSSGKTSSSYDTEVSALSWNEETGKASWKGNAQKYTVRLYRGSSQLTSVTTKSRSYDFSSYFTQSGVYTFRVRGTADGDNGDFVTSEELSVTSPEAAAIKKAGAGSSSSGTGTEAVSSVPSSPTSGSSRGAWLQDANGWWYCNADRSYTVNNWQFIDGLWYFFDERGYMKTGWLQWNGVYYYLMQDGHMQTSGWTEDNYYVNSAGIWVPDMGHPTSGSGQ